jgi:spore germination cell wall hydrolase CwlJ-like protein
MHKRLYILGSLFAISALICLSTAFSNDKILDVHYNQLTKDAQKQVDCLAQNIYHEAGYESETGKEAVAMVTLNRTQDPRFPKDICSVVQQKVNSTCQFSWYCMSKTAISNMFVYNQARNIAVYVYANYEKMADVTEGALYYHADYVNPRWRLQQTTKIGRHIFYKEKDGS